VELTTAAGTRISEVSLAKHSVLAL